MNQIVINADDFGLTESCTLAIITAFLQSLITDTTMVANGVAFKNAVSAAIGDLDGHVGVHLNLTEGRPLTAQIASFPEFCADGMFHGKFNRYKPLSNAAKNAVYIELTAQIRKIQDAGVHITHADSHHHIHTSPFIAKVVFQVCQDNGIQALRLHRNFGSMPAYKAIGKQIYNSRLRSKFVSTDYFCDISDICGDIPNGNIEIMTHPDYDEHNLLIDRCSSIRIKEVSILANELTGYKKISYSELKAQ